MRDLSNDVVVHRSVEGFEFLQFRKLLELGVKHAYSLKPHFFNTRPGVVSKETYDKAVENYGEFCKVMGFDCDGLVKCNQTHTNCVKVVDKFPGRMSIEEDEFKDVDGLVTNVKGVSLASCNADCILLLFYDPVKKVIGNVHSGWRGTFAKIAVNGVDAMVENISKLLDIYPGHITLDTSPTDDGIKACGKINMCIVALNEDEFPVFIERSFEYSHPISAADCNAMIFPSVRMSSVSYRLADDNSVELRCEMKLSGGAVNNESYRAVSGVEVNKDQPLETDDCALTLYYAAEGESLWDIAKSHKTGLELLLAENELEESTVERPQMLLIPKI